MLNLLRIDIKEILDVCSLKMCYRGLFSMALLLGMFLVSTPSVADDNAGWWGKIDYDGNPWVKNDSKPIKITKGLSGRHIALWASHGKFYDMERNKWRWQRPNMFCTNEDMFTQTFVVPYLIPMLELSGANVFTPRERDWQTHEVVIDNDGATMMADGNVTVNSFANYVEEGNWKNYVTSGFQIPSGGMMKDGDMPFAQGTARTVTSSKRKADAFAIYSPKIAEKGRYAVYVSYQTVAESVDDAHYIVVHQGVETHFCVNQRMGGGTWVYLGTFEFDEGTSMDNCVIVDNKSSRRGVVSTDAVRFGGGMGNILRGGKTSEMPRCLESARYYAQWAGAPYNIYSTRGGKDDYADDINVRSLMSNWLAGGSPYVPDRDGKNVPIELSLAVHSDAGYARDMKSVFGSLGICTTNFNDERLASGLSRFYSRDFISLLLDQLDGDLKKTYGAWAVRDLYDKNYSETRLPGVPSAIIELLSHQSFPDMKLAHDPNFKFTVSRAIYKAILRFITNAHDKKYVVAPLQPQHFCVTMDGRGKATLSWTSQEDKLEPKAKAKSFILYTAIGNGGFDNGKKVKGTNCSVFLEKNVVYRFRVSAVNEGGESFPSEELAAYYAPDSRGQLLVVNSFHRLASPAVKMQGTSSLGFDMDEESGMSYGLTAGWVGKQQVFSTVTAGREGPGTFGYSGEEMAGGFVAGNDFNYTTEHVAAMASSGKYSVVSCSDECVGKVSRLTLADYPLVDIILGNECNDGYSLVKYKSFAPNLKSALRKYRGALFVSGSYVASDNLSADDSSFISEVLHVTLRGKNRSMSPEVKGMGTSFHVWRSLNALHYASTSSDILGVAGETMVVKDSIESMMAADSISGVRRIMTPSDNINSNTWYVLPDNNAFTALTYSDGSSAAIAYQKNDESRTFTMGFPFECIRRKDMQNAIMQGIMNFLLGH